MVLQHFSVTFSMYALCMAVFIDGRDWSSEAWLSKLATLKPILVVNNVVGEL